MALKNNNGFDLKELMSRVGPGNRGQKFTKNQVIYHQGDQADSVHYISSGRVKIVVNSQQGREAIVALLTEGEFFGEGCLGGQSKRTASVKAIEDCTIVRIGKEAIIKLLKDDPPFSNLFMNHLLLRSVRVEEDVVDLLFNSSEKRLARALLLLANFGKEGKPAPITPLLNHETLAEIVGTTRSRITFFMNKFRRLGYIDYNGSLQIHNTLLGVVLNDKNSSTKITGPARPPLEFAKVKSNNKKKSIPTGKRKSEPGAAR